LRRAPIGTLALVQNQLAHGLLDDLIDRHAEFQLASFVRRRRFGVGRGVHLHDDFVLKLAQARLARELVGVLNRLFERLARERLDRLLDFGRHKVEGHFRLRLARPRAQFFNQRNHFLVLQMRQLDGLHHHRFGHFVGVRFDHHHMVRATGDHQLQVRKFADFAVRVDNKVAVHIPDAHGAERSVPRDVGDGERGGRADDAQHSGRMVKIHRERQHNHLHLVAHALREQRANRAVYEASLHYRFVGGAAPALNKAARDFPDGVLTLLEVHNQREKVDIGARFLAHRRGDQHHALAIAHHDCRIRLIR
jgi:hypothetical protein